MRYWLILLGIVLSGTWANAQTALNREITADYQDITLIEVLLDLERRYPPTKFYYEPEVLPYYKIKFKTPGTSIFDALQTILPENGLVCAASGDHGVIICKKTDLNRPYISKLLKKWEEGSVEMPEFLQPVQLRFTLGSAPSEPGTVVVKGNLLDDQSREPMPGAIVRLDPPLTGAATTNALGQFTLKLPANGEVANLRVEYPGYRVLLAEVTVFQAGSIELPMQQRLQNLQEVVISGNKAADRVSNTSTGLEQISTQMIKELPSFAGEADVVKSLSILPGVSTVGEGAAGFNVRGGNIDQNLVLQDGLPFFNTSHVLGFFSVFNPDLVGNTTLHKGHIPASYGGRISSVLDVQLRQPNFREWHGSAGLGLLTGKAYVEGPVVREKLAVIAGARASYSDWLLKQAKLPSVRDSRASFWDFTGKAVWRYADNGSVEFSGHTSTDYFRFGLDFGYEWATNGGAAIWRHAFNEKWIWQAQAALGQLTNTYFTPEGFDAFSLSSGLQYQRGRTSMLWIPKPSHEVRFGVEWNRSTVLQQNFEPLAEDLGVRPRQVPGQQGAELGFFAEDEWKVTDRISVYAGLRYSTFRQIGEGRTYLYAPDQPITVLNTIDTAFFVQGATMQRYGGFEPRLSANYRLNEKASIKASYNRLRQYLHLISNTTAATPADIWQVSTPYIPPQIGDSYSVGYYHKNKYYEHTVEGFFKKVEQVAGYRDFADLLLNDHIETELITGRMRSYGFEYALKKNQGKLTGWLAYTYSRALQQARSEFPTISVNRGAWFPANFDQPHQLNVFAKYAYNPSHYWTFNFTYRSGRPVSAPLSGYLTGNVVLPYFPERNNFRIRDYHRLDVGYTIDRNKAKLDGISYLINFSVYNLYARENPFAVYFRRDKQGIPKAYQLSAIGNAIPTITFTLVW
jgi:outer membrane receptor protein involved in Fe transport